MGKRKTLSVGIGEESAKKGNIKKGGIEKGDLLKALDRIKPALSREEGQYLFMGDKIASYNNEDICIVVPFPIGFSGSVGSDAFYKLISGTTDDIQLKLKENQIVVKAGSASFGLAHTESEDVRKMVESLEHDALQWRPLVEEMRRAIVLCSFSASKDTTKPHLMGVYVGEGSVMSSDNYRISWYQLEEGIRRSFLVPATSVVHLVNYDFLDEYALTDSWVHFKGEDMIFSALLLAEEFPQKAKDFFPEEEKESFDLPEELTAVLDKALILLQKDSLLDKQTTLTFDKSSVICSAEKQDLGWFKEAIAMKGPKKPVKAEINPVFLKEILKRSTQAIFVDENRMMFVSDNFKHLISLG